jgi:hypothetical protein
MAVTSATTSRPAVLETTGWAWLSYGYAALVVAGMTYALVDLPVQVSDSYGNIVKASSGSLGSLVAGEFHQAGYLRPLLWGQLRVVMDISGGRYYEWFRAWHAGQLALLTLLFVHIVRPRRWADAMALPIGLAALVGMHTFAGTVREAFPINTFMTILLCCLAAADLALGPPRWWRDVAGAVLSIAAALTVESGLLVPVIFVAARIAGARGVSPWGIATQVGLVAGYFVLRFAVLHVGSPQLQERSSGFGFSMLDPADLIARFGGNPLPFYAYNVASSILSVFVSEPRGGLWVATRTVMAGTWSSPATLNVVASLLASGFILRFVWARRREWWARHTDRADQIVLVFLAVTLANAVISYAYTKDVILSPAGVFFALALTVALAHALEAARGAGIARVSVVAALLLALSTAWAGRVAGSYLGLRHAAAVMRQEWAYVDQMLAREPHADTSAVAIRLKRQLQEDAVRRHPVRPALRGDWVEWFDE